MKVQYIKNEKGEEKWVVLLKKDFEAMIEELEDFEAIRLYDAAKKEKQEFIKAEDMFEEIESKKTEVYV